MNIENTYPEFYVGYDGDKVIDYTFNHEDIVTRIEELEISMTAIARMFGTLDAFTSGVSRRIEEFADAEIGVNWGVIDYNIKHVMENP